jgi:hypothetical protein
MPVQFNYEQLIVYQRSLEACRRIRGILPGFDPRHAVTDHLRRASESVVVNLAEASAAFGQADGSPTNVVLVDNVAVRQ